MEKFQSDEYSPQAILKRIDHIIVELQTLRQAVADLQTEAQPPAGDLVEALAGSLGQGSWNEYDQLLDWERFSE